MILAARVPSYRPFEPDALAHLAGLGVRAVEIRAPDHMHVLSMRDELARAGLRATTVQIECDLARADADAQVASQMPILRALDTRIALLALRPLEIPRETQLERLRLVCRAAHDAGVTLAAETHPDLFTNAADTRNTLIALAAPNLGVNFDPANIHFYNRETLDPLAELRQIVGHVVSVHLKDTPGGYRVRDFPALGEGCIDFAGLLRALHEARFTGPLTLEIEGAESQPRTREAIFDRFERSVAHIRRVAQSILPPPGLNSP